MKKRREKIRNYNMIKMKTWHSPALSRDTVVPERGEKKNVKFKYKLNSQIICPASLRDTAPARKERRKLKIKMKR